MSQPTYVCQTAGCPREGQPTRSRRCVACGMAKRPTVITRNNADGQTRSQGPTHLRPSNGLPSILGKGWRLTATAAGIGALVLLCVRLLVRTHPSRHIGPVRTGRRSSLVQVPLARRGHREHP
jgi:hypothetical protein